VCLKSATNVLLIVFKAAEIKNALKKVGVKIPPNESNANTGTSVVSIKDGRAWNGEDTLSLLWPIDEDCKLQMETHITEDESAEDESAEDESAEDENAEDENAEDENAEDENAEDENAEDENAEDENAEDENAETPKTRKHEKSEVLAPPGSLVLIFEFVSFDALPGNRYIWTRFGTSKVQVPAEEA